MKTQGTNCSNVLSQPFFGRSTTAKETTVRHTNMFVALCSLVLLLTLSPAWGQGTSTCGLPNPAGGRFCVSPQYRFGPELTGAPAADVLGVATVPNVYLKFNRNTNSGGGFVPAGPTSSPSVITRAIFASQDNNGNWGLWAYNAPGGGSFGWSSVTQNPSLNIGLPIRSSPGYPSKNAEPYIYAGGEDGNIYAFGYTTGVLGWMYKTNDAIDSSPTVSDANEVYMINASGYIYKLDGYSGAAIWPEFASGLTPGDGSSGSPSASSLALSDVPCPGSCTWLFAGGSSLSNTGSVKAFDAVTGSSTAKWSTQLPQPVTSSPVVSKSNRLVYVQSKFDYYTGFDGKEIYALDELSGSVVWSALPPQVPMPPVLPPCPNVVGHYFSEGSPAYDQNSQIVVASLKVIYDYSSCGTQFKYSVLTAFDATRGGNGAVKWSIVITNPITDSSPTVANGVVYIGTDDGYILAFNEANGNLLWTSPQLDSGLLSPPVVGFNRIYATTQQGTLYVYGLTGY
jgi:outer membrane protein assembly factor BamB